MRDSSNSSSSSSSSSSSPSPSASSSSFKLSNNKIITILLFIMNLIIISWFYYCYSHLLSKQNSMENDIISLKNQNFFFNTMLSDMKHVQSNDIKISNNIISKNVTKLSTEVESLSKDLATRFRNTTSNADVLLEMKKTKKEIELDLLTTNSKIENTISDAKRNVSTVQNKVHVDMEALQYQLEVAQLTIKTEVEDVKETIKQYVIITNQQITAENDFVKYQIAGTFTLLACLISLYHISNHYRYLKQPDIQRRVMAVLMMVPVYSLTSWLSLVTNLESVFGSIRDVYEAYVIYTFLAFLISVLEVGITDLRKRNDETEEAWIERKRSSLISKLAERVVQERKEIANAKANNQYPLPTEHLLPPLPFCYVNHKPSTVAAAWLNQCQLLCMQFALLKPLLAIIPMLIKNYDNIYIISKSGYLNFAAPKLYIYFLQNVSVGIAFYGLLKFYHGTESDLAYIQPFGKFLTVKFVVLVTFWQNIALQGMAILGIVETSNAMQVQNLLICIEMLVASLIHIYIFPYEEWESNYKRETLSVLEKASDALAIGDMRSDIHGIGRVLFNKSTWAVTSLSPRGGLGLGSAVEGGVLEEEEGGGEGEEMKLEEGRRGEFFMKSSRKLYHSSKNNDNDSTIDVEKTMKLQGGRSRYSLVESFREVFTRGKGGEGREERLAGAYCKISDNEDDFDALDRVADTPGRQEYRHHDRENDNNYNDDDNNNDNDNDDDDEIANNDAAMHHQSNYSPIINLNSDDRSSSGSNSDNSSSSSFVSGNLVDDDIELSNMGGIMEKDNDIHSQGAGASTTTTTTAITTNFEAIVNSTIIDVIQQREQDQNIEYHFKHENSNNYNMNTDNELISLAPTSTSISISTISTSMMLEQEGSINFVTGFNHNISDPDQASKELIDFDEYNDDCNISTADNSCSNSNIYDTNTDNYPELVIDEQLFSSSSLSSSLPSSSLPSTSLATEAASASTFLSSVHSFNETEENGGKKDEA